MFDIAWFDDDGENVSEASWNNPEHRLLSLRRATKNADESVSILTYLLNPTDEDHTFKLPEPALPAVVFVDTAQPELSDVELKEKTVNVRGHSAVLIYSNLKRPEQ